VVALSSIVTTIILDKRGYSGRVLIFGAFVCMAVSFVVGFIFCGPATIPKLGFGLFGEWKIQRLDPAALDPTTISSGQITVISTAYSIAFVCVVVGFIALSRRLRCTQACCYYIALSRRRRRVDVAAVIVAVAADCILGLLFIFGVMLMNAPNTAIYSLMIGDYDKVCSPCTAGTRTHALTRSIQLVLTRALKTTRTRTLTPIPTYYSHLPHSRLSSHTCVPSPGCIHGLLPDCPRPLPDLWPTRTCADFQDGGQSPLALHVCALPALRGWSHRTPFRVVSGTRGSTLLFLNALPPSTLLFFNTPSHPLHASFPPPLSAHCLHIVCIGTHTHCTSLTTATTKTCCRRTNSSPKSGKQRLSPYPGHGLALLSRTKGARHARPCPAL
jgi:hypothetical protein